MNLISIAVTAKHLINSLHVVAYLFLALLPGADSELWLGRLDVYLREGSRLTWVIDAVPPCPAS